MSAEHIAEFETKLAGHCDQAELTPLQKEIVLLHLVDRMKPAQIRLKLKSDVKRVADVQRLLETGLARLSSVPGFWGPTRQFGRDLLFCIEDRKVYDDRPEGVRGVTSAEAPGRFQGAPVVSAQAIAAEQDIRSAARLWANQLQPVQVPDYVAAG